MAIASFAGKEFSVSINKVYPFSDLTISGSISTEAQERTGQKPATYIKGLGLESFSISIPLIAQKNLNVRSEWDVWKKIRDARVPNYFILASRPIIPNKLLLQSVDLADTVIDPKGNIIKASLQLKFEEYTATGSAQTSKKSKTRSNPNYTESTLSGEELEDTADDLF